jgi:hypothetical protein
MRLLCRGIMPQAARWEEPPSKKELLFMATFRTVFRSDIDHLKAHNLRLDSRDRTLRFFGRVSVGFIKSHCEEIDWPQACIVGCLVEGMLRGVVELYLDRAYWDPWRGLRLGRDGMAA